MPEQENNTTSFKAPEEPIIEQASKKSLNQKANDKEPAAMVDLQPIEEKTVTPSPLVKQ